MAATPLPHPPVAKAALADGFLGLRHTYTMSGCLRLTNNLPRCFQLTRGPTCFCQHARTCMPCHLANHGHVDWPAPVRPQHTPSLVPPSPPPLGFCNPCNIQCTTPEVCTHMCRVLMSSAGQVGLCSSRRATSHTRTLLQAHTSTHMDTDNSSTLQHVAPLPFCRVTTSTSNHMPAAGQHPGRKNMPDAASPLLGTSVVTTAAVTRWHVYFRDPGGMALTSGAHPLCSVAHCSVSQCWCCRGNHVKRACRRPCSHMPTTLVQRRTTDPSPAVQGTTNREAHGNQASKPLARVLKGLSLATSRCCAAVQSQMGHSSAVPGS